MYFRYYVYLYSICLNQPCTIWQFLSVVSTSHFLLQVGNCYWIFFLDTHSRCFSFYMHLYMMCCVCAVCMCACVMWCTCIHNYINTHIRRVSLEHKTGRRGIECPYETLKLPPANLLYIQHLILGEHVPKPSSLDLLTVPKSDLLNM